MSEDSSNEKSAYELLREQNIRERQALFASTVTVTAVNEAINNIQKFSQATRKPVPKRRRSTPEPSCSYTVSPSAEVRRSQRIANIPAPQYADEELETLDRKASVTGRSEIGSERSPTKARGTKNRVLAAILPVEEVTEEMLSNIAVHSRDRVLDKRGVVCHQCRQKTRDTKTVCRSGFCYGKNGHFCDPCLRGRYGETVAWALKEPNWSCPYCRNICNCSICRARQGKAATGALAPKAIEQGYKSAYHLLNDIKNDEKVYKFDPDEEENLTGFDIEGNPVMI